MQLGLENNLTMNEHVIAMAAGDLQTLLQLCSVIYS